MMRTTTARALVVLAAAFVCGAAPLFAQGWRKPAPDVNAPRAQAAQDARSVEGQLMRVDTEATTITIQSSQGAPMVFRYTDATRVVGGDRGVAGLATMTGDEVRI